MKEHEKIFKAFANRRRLGLIKYLKSHSRVNVGDLATTINLSFKSTSKHLAVLSAADIVEREQQNLSMLYSLARKQSSLVKNIIGLL